MDALIQHVVEEIALDGEMGSDVERFSSFVQDYYRNHSHSSTFLSHTSSGVENQALVDSTLLNFVWRILLNQDGIKAVIAEVHHTGSKRKAVTSQERASSNASSPASGNRLAETTSPLTSFTTQILPMDETSLGREQLVERYNTSLRLKVDEEQAWVAITGSHSRPSRLTPRNYEALQLVCRARGEGVTAVELGEALAIDQKSVFHQVKILQELGLVKKFRTYASHFATNRILHVRFLSVSEHWRVHTDMESPEKDMESTNVMETERGEDSDAETSPNDKGTAGMSYISPRYLYENVEFIRQRILRALQLMDQHFMPSVHLETSIGLFDCTRYDSRRLRSIISKMIEEGSIERILVRQAGREGKIHCTRLVTGVEMTSTEDLHINSPLEVTESKQVALMNIPLERQMADFLASVGSKGATTEDIMIALGGLSDRYVNWVMERLQQNDPPGNLANLTVRAMIEMDGREKRTRWFLLPGYIDRCKKDKIPYDDSLEETLNSNLIGGWSAVEMPPQYHTLEHYDELCARLDESTKFGTVGKSKGKGSQAKGRPLKKPRPANAPMTYYERKKREAEERRQQGLPPISKRPSAYGGRKPKNWIKSEEENQNGKELEESASNSEAPLSSYKLTTPAFVFDVTSGDLTRAETRAEVTDSSSPAHVEKGENIGNPEIVNTLPTMTASQRDGEAPKILTERSQASQREGRRKHIPVNHARDRPSEDSHNVPLDQPKSRVHAHANEKTQVFRIESPSQPTESSPALITTRSLRSKGPRSAVPIQEQSAVTSFPKSPQDPNTVVTYVTEGTQENILSRNGDTLVTNDEGSFQQSHPEVIAAHQILPALDTKPNLDPLGKREKTNLTAVKRQADILAWIGSCGGIVDNLSLNERVRIFIQERDSQLNIPLMTSSTYKPILDDLVRRGELCRIVTQTPLRSRAEILHLKKIKADDPKLLAFLAELPDSDPHAFRRKARWGGVAEADDLMIYDYADVEYPEPQVSDSPSAVQGYFRQVKQVFANRHGVIYGRFARARAMHTFLVKYARESTPENSNVSWDSSNTWPVLKKDVIFSAMPLKTYLLTVPIAGDAIGFDNFVKDAKNQSACLRDLPRWVRKVFSRKNDRKVILSILHTLTALELLEPLVELHPSGNTDENQSRFKRTSKLSYATHWRVMQHAPLYHFNRPDMPIAGIFSIDGATSVETYWRALRKACLPTSEVPNPQPLISNTNSEFALNYCGPSNLSNSITSTSKWHAQYFLLKSQRKYLYTIAEKFEHNEIPQEVIAPLGELIFAPQATIIECLRQIRLRSRLKPDSRLRKRQKIQELGEDAQEMSEVVSFDRKAVEIALRQKTRDTGKQKIKDWNSILTRFREDHGDPYLDQRALDHLRERFCDPRSSMDLNQLTYQFDLLSKRMPHSTDFQASTVLLSAMRNSSSNVYLHRRSNSNTGSARPLLHRNLNVESAAKAQNTQRRIRYSFSADEDELILDAMAVIEVRADSLGIRPTFGSLSQLFANVSSNQVRVHFKKLMTKAEDKVYFDRLRKEWYVVYSMHREALDLLDTVPDDMLSFDLASLISYLREKVDKDLLRLSGPVEPSTIDFRPLPARISSHQKLSKRFTKSNDGPEPADWSDYWSRHGTLAHRESDAFSLPFAVKCMYEVRTQGIGVSKAVAAIKMVLATPSESYSKNLAKSLLSACEPYLESAIDSMTDMHIVKTASKALNVGQVRNALSLDRYFSLFEENRVVGKLKGALDYLSYSQSKSFRWPLVVEDETMIAFAAYIYKNVLHLTIDRTLPSACLDFDDYQTRQTGDNDIECRVNCLRFGALQQSMKADVAGTFPEVLPTERRNEMLSNAANIEADVLKVLLERGPNGATTATLSRHLSRAWSELLPVLKHLTSSSVSLAFWAGDVRPVLVHYTYLKCWMLPKKRTTIAPLLHRDASSPLLVFWPVVWVDINGSKIPGAWDTVSEWLQNVIMTHPGATCEELHHQAQKKSLLTLQETMCALELLKVEGKVGTSARGLPAHGDAGDIFRDWSSNRWYII